jgi:hypothetical protein
MLLYRCKMEDPEPLPVFDAGSPTMGYRPTSLPSTRSSSNRSTPVDVSSHRTPKATPEENLKEDVAPDPSPSKREGLRKRTAASTTEDEVDAVAEAMKPLTEEERKKWKGWVELESDPVCSTPISV